MLTAVPLRTAVSDVGQGVMCTPAAVSTRYWYWRWRGGRARFNLVNSDC